MKKKIEQQLKKCQQYVDKHKVEFGLHDWDIGVRLPHKDDPIDFLEGNESVVFYDMHARNASIIFVPEWPAYWPQSDEALEETMRHELAHVALAPLITLTTTRFNVTKEAIEQEEHRIINVWMNMTKKKK